MKTYSDSLKDKRQFEQDQRRGQARLLTPTVLPYKNVVNGAAIPTDGPTMIHIPPDLLVEHVSNSEGSALIAREDMQVVQFKLSSKSVEGFSDIRVAVVDTDGQTIVLHGGFPESLAPEQEIKYTWAFKPRRLRNPLRARVTFQDANGRSWEKVTGESLRELENYDPEPLNKGQAGTVRQSLRFVQDGPFDGD